MGNEHGEAQLLAAIGALVRVRGPSELLRRLREQPCRLRKATGPAPQPTGAAPAVVEPSMWLEKPPRSGCPYRRRHCQWRVVFHSKIVARARPTTSAPTVDVLAPGRLVWSEAPRPDGWVVLSDPGIERRYVLIDATSLGLARLLERVEPPILDEGACATCFAAPCYCDVLEDYAR